MAGYSSHSSTLFLLLLVVVSGWGGLSKCEAFGTFGFDVHHRFSDPVKGILAVDELPEKGSVNYYAVMAHRDRLIRGRRLASLEQQTPLTALTFLNGNDTYRIEVLGLYGLCLQLLFYCSFYFILKFSGNYVCSFCI